jgi:hypothetical protein
MPEISCGHLDCLKSFSAKLTMLSQFVQFLLSWSLSTLDASLRLHDFVSMLHVLFVTSSTFSFRIRRRVS